MSRWINGMMNACAGKVKAWDVVNEAISGGDSDGDGVYDLQHYNGDESNFFWQDHMGDLEYTRQAVRLARLHYANSMSSKGGDDGKLTLFVNDYNLESDWDGNGKLKSLIKWIERWEADGVTKIDGIGSQMHISCYMNESTQTSKKNAVENSFKLMAATGKLVRISELDMGMVDASGKDVPTANMTEAMHQRMASYYEWIIKKYLEIVPAKQQWAICQWCATDSPTNSGWRANTPVGLWTLDWYRKHTYAGFARGLGAPANPTAVNNVKEDLYKPDSSPIYNLIGRNVGNDFEQLPAGIYIQNGKKYVKR
jgi:GH35 family endo-1,4-beta-xylanase